MSRKEGSETWSQFKRFLGRRTCLNSGMKEGLVPRRANKRRRFRTDHLEMGTAKVHRQG